MTCVDSHVRGGRTVCLEGAMYCVDGIWSDCQDVYEWTLPAGAALIATLVPLVVHGTAQAPASQNDL